MSVIAPQFIYLLAALALPLLPVRWRHGVVLATPILALLLVISHAPGVHYTINAVGFELSFVRMDELARVFAIIFSVAAALAALYAWHVRDLMHQIAATVYSGAALGGVLAADLVSLFVWWEMTALASVFLIWAQRSTHALAAGLRYLIVQVTSGVLLLAGLLLHFYDTGSTSFEHLGLVSTGTALMFIGFGIKCAFPLVHNWLQEAYSTATVTGTVLMSALTTKLAIYALARGFAGTELLITIGAIMAVFPVLLAMLDNDLRRVLAYGMNSQLGFMVVGVGIGTDLSLNGTVAHAVCSILYTGLLFMCVGAVVHRTGTAKASELGGLWRSMPITAACCVVGGASIGAFPLLSGFVSKSMTVSAAAYEGHYLVWLLLLVASIGAIAHTAIRVPFAIFAGEDSGVHASEAPVHMRYAMLAAAGLCVLIGLLPAGLYALLPYEADYSPFSLAHLLTQLQMIVFAAIAYVLLQRRGRMLADTPHTLLDTDVAYRRWAPRALAHVVGTIAALNAAVVQFGSAAVQQVYQGAARISSPDAPLAQAWRVGTMMLVVIIAMLLVLVVNLF